VAALSLRGIAKRFGATKVVHHLDLEVRDEEFMVLIGPSGCGKSTLLRLIAGLEEPDEGRIAIGDRDVTDAAPKDRDIAMVFQNYALYPHMNVRENLAFGLKMRKTPKAEVRRRVDEAAGILGIEDLLERKPRQLSGGQRQRVAVGRAIVRNPAVFLFDEPLSNLDAKLRAEMRTEISRLQDQLRTTTVYVTHDQVEAMTMGDRIAVLHRGVLQQVGTPLELYDEPTNVFVAGFIGMPPMSLIEAAVAGSGDMVSIDGVAFAVPERFRPAMQHLTSGRVLLGIRPESLSDSSPAQRTVKLRTIVEIAEPLGHEVVVQARLGAHRLTGKLEAHHVPKPGEPLELLLDAERVQLFDPATGLRLRP